VAATETTPTRPDVWTIVGIVACALPVAAFSSYSQFMTAHGAGMPLQLAWVLPMATDATAFVATRVWLSPLYTPGVRRYAASLVLTCMVLSFAGASIHLALPVLPRWMGLPIGGLPSLALAGLVHLGALVGAGNKQVAAPSTASTNHRRRSRGATTGAGDAGLNSAPPAPSVVPAARTAPASTPAADASAGASVVTLGDRGAVRAQMLNYLDEHPNATGADLDRTFGTSNYGRTVVRHWKRHRQPADQASGE